MSVSGRGARRLLTAARALAAQPGAAAAASTAAIKAGAGSGALSSAGALSGSLRTAQFLGEGPLSLRRHLSGGSVVAAAAAEEVASTSYDAGQIQVRGSGAAFFSPSAAGLLARQGLRFVA